MVLGPVLRVKTWGRSVNMNSCLADMRPQVALLRLTCECYIYTNL